MRVLGRPCAVADPMHVRNLLGREPGGPHVAYRRWSDGTRRKGRRPNTGDVRPGEVGQARSTDETAEQRRRPAAEVVEGRGLAKGNTDEQNAPWTPSRTSAPSAHDRVREAAARNKGMRFTAPLHHVDVDRLRTAFRTLKKDAAPAVDGVTWQQCAGGGPNREARVVPTATERIYPLDTAISRPVHSASNNLEGGRR